MTGKSAMATMVESETSRLIDTRVHGLLFDESIMSNPNGDPDMCGDPRVDSEGYGIITDAAKKRLMRNYLRDVDGFEILCETRTNKNRRIAELGFDDHVELIADKDRRTVAQMEHAISRICDRAIDTRLFGGVLSTGPNAGQLRASCIISPGLTRERVTVNRASITPSMSSDWGKDIPKDSLEALMEWERNVAASDLQTMGKRACIEHGLYEFQVFLNPADAQRNKLSILDFCHAMEAAVQCNSYYRSATRTNSVTNTLVLFIHDGFDFQPPNERARTRMLGCVNEAKLRDLVTARYDEERKRYIISVNEHDVPPGVRMLRFTYPDPGEVFRSLRAALMQ